MAINITRTAGVDTEQIITAQKARLILVVPEVAVTAGTITLRDDNVAGGSNVVHVAAAGLGPAGKAFAGGQFNRGITIQHSDAADRCAVVWEAV